ncbi:MAG TPA: ISL3 family transposase [Acidothermaceae bacterium]
MSNGTTILFGLSGVSVQRVERAVDGSRTVHVVTADSSAAGCPRCGVLSTSVKEHVTTTPKDLPYGESEMSVIWHKVRWRCRELMCARSSFTEQIGEVPAGRRTTGRLRRAIGSAVGDAARSVAEVADAFNVTWPTAHKAFVEHAQPRLGEPEPTPVLGIDETRRGKPRWFREPATGAWTRLDPYDTGFVDLAGAQGLLGQVEGRTSKCVVDWLQARTPAFRAAVRFVAIDPAAVYAAAIRTPGLLPNATIVVDHFHIVKLANDTLTKVRRRVTWDQKGRRGRKIDPAWANRRRLLTARERLSDKGFATMWNSLIDSDPTNQILAAWIAKEELRALLALARTGPIRGDIDRRLFAFYHWCANTDIDELHTLATTVETWWPAIEAFIVTGITNAKTEGLNRLVKQVKRSACGFRSIANQHRRVRFHCTRTHRATTATSRQLPAQS